jgi:hypothetical protein
VVLLSTRKIPITFIYLQCDGDSNTSGLVDAILDICVFQLVFLKTTNGGAKLDKDGSISGS